LSSTFDRKFFSLTFDRVYPFPYVCYNDGAGGERVELWELEAILDIELSKPLEEQNEALIKELCSLLGVEPTSRIHTQTE